MAAMIQTYPHQTGSVTMLQTRPSSSSGITPSSSSQSQMSQQYNSHRNSFHALSGGNGGQTMYRGTSGGPIQPYAFTATPGLAQNTQWQQYGGYRTSSTPNLPTMQMVNPLAQGRPQQSSQMVAAPSYAQMVSKGAAGFSRDDSSLPSGVRPAQTVSRSSNGSSNQLNVMQPTSTKVSPERYRRPSPRHTDSYPTVQQAHGMQPGNGVANVQNPRIAPEVKGVTPRNITPLNRPHSFYAAMPISAKDDIQLHRQPTPEELKRFRRRSMHSIDSTDYPIPLTPQELKQAEESFRNQTMAASKKNNASFSENKLATRSAALAPPVEKSSASHARNGSSESLSSSRSSHSRPSSANRNSNASPPTTSPSSVTTASDDRTLSNQDQVKLVNIPPRSSSATTDVGAKRVVNPSPLSKPVTMAPDSAASGSSTNANDAAASTVKPPTSSQGSNLSSPAAKQLAALQGKGAKGKTKTSRLRRAFSFGSAAELKNASGPEANNGKAGDGAEPARLRKDPRPEDLYEEEQARIAQKQEEAGIGASIYSGTKLFSGSTDNLSISSTASSASIMLRKMGRGMKKGGRNLVGLFRPKSVIGVPPPDIAQTEVSQASVSMITVEAERERVNVNPDVHSQQAGGTGFPRLERNSLDATGVVQPERAGSSGTDNSGPRKSIVGGERERAEVLAAVRKGILKRRDSSSSPVPRGVDNKAPNFELPMIPHVNDSPSSSAPSTPNDDAQGHRRTGSVAVGNEDYFMSALRLRQDTKSAPGTPSGSHKRNATFSPRIVFHDTWPSGEYDRRGEIATCNRLTPMLAQQIKEELNSFKMEMEVHETSKIYTHFF